MTVKNLPMALSLAILALFIVPMAYAGPDSASSTESDAKKTAKNTTQNTPDTSEHMVAFSFMSISSDGSKVLSNAPGGKVTLWDTETGKVIHTFAAYAAEDYLDYDKSLVEQLVDEMNADPEAAENLFEKLSISKQPPVACGAFSLDGTKAVTGTLFALKLWDVGTGECLRTFKTYPLQVFYATVSPDAKVLYSAGLQFYSANVDRWDVTTGKRIPPLKMAGTIVRSMACSPDGRTLVTSGTINIPAKSWDLATGREVCAMPHYRTEDSGHNVDSLVVAISPDGTKVLTCSHDKIAKLWDLKNCSELRRFIGHSEDIHAVCFSPDGRKAVTGATHENNLEVKLWDTETGANLWTFSGAEGSVETIAFFKSEPKIVVGSSEVRAVWVLDMESGKELRKTPLE